MINMIAMGLNLNDYLRKAGDSREPQAVKSQNSGQALLKLEKEADSHYESWIAAVNEQDKISKAQFRSGGKTDFDARKLKLNESEKMGIAGIAEATGFSRTTVHTFYALSVQSGLVSGMKEFVTKMVGEPTQSYGHLKNRLTADEGAKILSTVV